MHPVITLLFRQRVLCVLILLGLSRQWAAAVESNNMVDEQDELLAGLTWEMPATSKARLAQMHGRQHPRTLAHLHEDAGFVKALHEVAGIGMHEGELPLV